MRPMNFVSGSRHITETGKGVRNCVRAWPRCSGDVDREFLEPVGSDPALPLIPSSARGIDGGPRRSTEVVLNEQSLPVAWWSHDERE